MASNIESYEYAQQDGVPVECYKFVNEGVSYLYTSKKEDVSIPITNNGITRTEKYYGDYIERSEAQPGSEGSDAEMTVTVSKECAVAMLYQGAPPEKEVELQIMRLHAQDYSKFDVIFYGRVTQASFKDSSCELTVKLENWLDKEIPNGNYQYFCNNMLFDCECRLNKADYQVDAMIDEAYGLQVFSTKFAEYEDGYFTGGTIKFENYIRMIDSHSGNCCTLRYPFKNLPTGVVAVLPGCNKKFSTCAKRFGNTDNFSGFMYVPPTDSEKNPTGTGAYWQDSEVIQRDTDGFVGTIDL